MGGSRIFDWGGPRIEKARDDGQKVALYPLRSCPIGGDHGPVAPPGTALEWIYMNSYLNYFWTIFLTYIAQGMHIFIPKVANDAKSD